MGARCAGSDPVPECTGATGTGNQYDQGLSGHAGLCAREDRDLSPWKQTGRSLSWTDRNVSVQELIIYQYSEEHVSPFVERKFGMG